MEEEMHLTGKTWNKHSWLKTVLTGGDLLVPFAPALVMRIERD